MQPNGRDDDKIIDIASARRRQRTLARSGASSGKPGKGGKPEKSGRQAPKVWVYLQVLLFLALVSYMMRLCKG
jgi:hypothetical protein